MSPQINPATPNTFFQRLSFALSVSPWSSNINRRQDKTIFHKATNTFGDCAFDLGIISAAILGVRKFIRGEITSDSTAKTILSWTPETLLLVLAGLSKWIGNSGKKYLSAPLVSNTESLQPVNENVILRRLANKLSEEIDEGLKEAKNVTGQDATSYLHTLKLTGLDTKLNVIKRDLERVTDMHFNLTSGKWYVTSNSQKGTSIMEGDFVYGLGFSFNEDADLRSFLTAKHKIYLLRKSKEENDVSFKVVKELDEDSLLGFLSSNAAKKGSLTLLQNLLGRTVELYASTGDKEVLCESVSSPKVGFGI